MTRPPGVPRIGIDARLGAYRGGGIAEHTRRLVEGLVALQPPERLLVLEHRRAGAAGSGAPGASGAQRDPLAPGLARRRLFTPPHHRWEGWTLPIELLPARLDLLHSPDVVPPRHWRGASVATVHDVAFLRRPELLTPESLRYYAGTADPARLDPGHPRPEGGVFRALRQADRVIAVSEHTARELVALAGADPAQVRVVPNSVHPRFRPQARPGDDPQQPAQAGLEADRAVLARLRLEQPYILFVSTIEPRKNLPTLLEAYRRLLDEGRDLDLALAGAEGWRSEAVHARVRALGLEGRLRWLGFVADADLPALYRGAALLAHPAVDEGFGFTPAEAMASGTPVVVSEAGSLPEIVGEAGLRVPPEDPAAWAAAMARVLDDPALAAELAARGPARAARFSLARQAELTLAVYREAWQVWCERRERRGPWQGRRIAA